MEYKSSNIFEKLVRMEIGQQMSYEIYYTIRDIFVNHGHDCMLPFMKGTLANSYPGKNFGYEISFEEENELYKITILLHISGDKVIRLFISDNLPNNFEIYKFYTARYLTKRVLEGYFSEENPPQVLDIFIDIKTHRFSGNRTDTLRQRYHLLTKKQQSLLGNMKQTMICVGKMFSTDFVKGSRAVTATLLSEKVRKIEKFIIDQDFLSLELIERFSITGTTEDPVLYPLLRYNGYKRLKSKDIFENHRDVAAYYVGALSKQYKLNTFSVHAQNSIYRLLSYDLSTMLVIVVGKFGDINIPGIIHFNILYHCVTFIFFKTTVVV